jgi:hypothetical protein
MEVLGLRWRKLIIAGVFCLYRIRVFDELVYDTDPNLTNVLIGTDWKLYRIDFTRAFRLY